MIEPRRWQRWQRSIGRLAVAALVLSAGIALDCATAPPAPPEPARPANVPGLVPIAGPGSASGSASQSAVSSTPGPATSETACPARVGDHAVKRSALNRTLDAGLGTWLRGIDVEPKIERGKFQGWLVRKVYVGDPCWADVDLKAGDVVSRVNRHAIERPEQAQEVWTALRTTGEIAVELFRGGKPRTLRFSVVDDVDRPD
jgi:S1-C subfamily serine protease